MRRLLGILDDLRNRLKNPDGYRSQETEDPEDAFLKQRHRAMGLEKLVPDPTALLVIDEADRLKIAGLEQTRAFLIGRDRNGSDRHSVRCQRTIFVNYWSVTGRRRALNFRVTPLIRSPRL